MDLNLFIMKNIQIYAKVECNELSRVHQTPMSISILPVLFHASFPEFYFIKNIFLSDRFKANPGPCVLSHANTFGCISQR